MKLDTQTQRTSSVRMGYLLVVLAVVLVPVVAHNQSHVSSTTTVPTTPYYTANMLVSGIHQW